MSMMDVARYLCYSNSVDVSPERDRYFNLSLANTTHLFSCLYGNQNHWSFGRHEKAEMHHPGAEGKMD